MGTNLMIFHRKCIWGIRNLDQVYVYIKNEMWYDLNYILLHDITQSKQDDTRKNWPRQMTSQQMVSPFLQNKKIARQAFFWKGKTGAPPFHSGRITRMYNTRRKTERNKTKQTTDTGLQRKESYTALWGARIPAPRYVPLLHINLGKGLKLLDR